MAVAVEVAEVVVLVVSRRSCCGRRAGSGGSGSSGSGSGGVSVAQRGVHVLDETLLAWHLVQATASPIP